MFSSGPSYNKLKTNLRLSINRLKLLEKKKTELALKSRKEIADYIAQGKAERAKIRVEQPALWTSVQPRAVTSVPQL